MVMAQVLEACLEEEQKRSQVRSLASLFQSSADGSDQEASKRPKIDSCQKGPGAAVQDSPAIFRFNFSDN